MYPLLFAAIFITFLKEPGGPYRTHLIKWIVFPNPSDSHEKQRIF
jgi:hypothetical protein